MPVDLNPWTIFRIALQDLWGCFKPFIAGWRCRAYSPPKTATSAARKAQPRRLTLRWVKQYGPRKAEEVYYATLNRNKTRMRRKNGLSDALKK